LSFQLTRVFSHLCRDLGVNPCDKQYVLNRLRHEGPAFVTKTLPTYSAWVLDYIENGPSKPPTAFALGQSKSPRFLRGFFFDAVNGCAVSLYCIRQLCEYAYKLCVEFPKDAEKEFCNSFKATDESVADVDIEHCNRLRKRFERYFPMSSRALPHHVFSEKRPRYGPGAFSGSGYLKEPHEVYKRLHDSITGTCSPKDKAFAGFFRPYPSCKEPIVYKTENPYSELCFVPKDSRGPRVISKEPFHAVRAQLSFNDYFTRLFEKESRYRINFVSQELNKRLAHEGSTSKQYSTIDLKNASDLVGFSLVTRIFRNSPALRFFSRRYSTRVVYHPLLGHYPIRKFANMGSGMCFPVLALICFLSVTEELSKFYGREQDIPVYVYGDDIIVPTKYYQQAINGLKKSGLAVNAKKSYTNSFFRESCGGDYYHGNDVGPCRLRLPNAKLPDLGGIRSAVVGRDQNAFILGLDRHCRELRKHQHWNLLAYYHKMIEKALGVYPEISEGCAALGKVTDNPPNDECLAYMPTTHKQYAPVSPFKGLGVALKRKATSEQPNPYDRVPLRRKISLGIRVVSAASRLQYGVTW